MTDDEVNEPELDPEGFEAMVAALLKVDPEGITGQRSAVAKEKKIEEKDEG